MINKFNQDDLAVSAHLKTDDLANLEQGQNLHFEARKFLNKLPTTNLTDGYRESRHSTNF